jgi:hypothetical protein
MPAMTTVPLTGRMSRVFAKFGRSRTYGAPRHFNDHMLKDIGLTADDLGLTRKR